MSHYSLLDLPLEIRTIIYNECFQPVPKVGEEASSKHKTIYLDLLLTSKSIRHDAWPVFAKQARLLFRRDKETSPIRFDHSVFTHDVRSQLWTVISIPPDLVLGLIRLYDEYVEEVDISMLRSRCCLTLRTPTYLICYQRSENGWRLCISLLGERGYSATHFDIQMTGDKKVDLKPSAKYLKEFARELLGVNRKRKSITQTE